MTNTVLLDANKKVTNVDKIQICSETIFTGIPGFNSVNSI